MGIVGTAKRFVSRLPGFAPGPMPGWGMTWWQEGRDLIQPRGDAMACSAVRASIDLISTTIASMPLVHRRRLPDGSAEFVDGGIQRLLNDPVRDVLTSLDFLDWMVTQLLVSGNAFAFATRDDVGRAVELHPLPTFAVQPITADDGAVYYRIGETFFDDVDSRIPGSPMATLRSADVLHLRIGAHRHPLLGLSPLDACRAAVDLDSVIRRHNISFHLNAARPSGAIIPDERLTTEQAQRLKALFASGTSQEAQGTPVVLPAKVQFQPFSVNAHDAETIALLKMSVLDVARVFRVPPPLLGDLSEASFSNVAELNRFFVSGLRFYTRSIALGIGRVLRLPANEFVAFDEDAALQPPSEHERLQALSEGVRGGVFTPNEARARMGLPPVPGGADVYLQRQNSPIRLLAAGEVAPIASAPGNGNNDEAAREDA